MITERLEKIQCWCERQVALIGCPRDLLVSELHCLGFGRPGQAVPTDWATYYSDEELREFVLEYADQFSPAL